MKSIEIDSVSFYKKRNVLFICCLLLLSIIDSGKYLGSNFFAPTYTIWLLEFCFLSFFFIYPAFKCFKYRKELKCVSLFVSYIIIWFLYSLLQTHGRSELLFILHAFPATILCMIIYNVCPTYLSLFYTHKIYYSFTILFLLLLPFWQLYEGCGYLMGLFLLPILFWTEYPFFKKILLLGLAIVIILIGYWTAARSQCIKYGVMLLAGFILCYFRTGFLKVYKLIGCLLLLMPFVLFYMAIYSGFNVFELDKYLSNSNKEVVADTRTIVYTEALNSAVDNNSIFIGRGFHHGYDSFFQWKREGCIGEDGSLERLSEAQILNYFTQGGILFVLLYFILCVQCFIKSFSARNDYVKMIGVLVCFIWFYSWVEFCLQVNITTLCLWFFYGICLSPEFRNMNNIEFKGYIKKAL